MRRICPACGTAVTVTARYCGACGVPLEQEERRRMLERHARRDDALGTGLAIVVVFAGTLLSIAIVTLLARGESTALASLARAALLLGVALTAAILLGHGAFARSFASLGTPTWAAWGLAIGTVAFAVNVAYVFALQALAGAGGVAGSTGTSLLFEVVDSAVVPALLEEWLCRGVLWIACRRATGPKRTIVATAALFSLLHGLGGGGFFEFPHRFVMGLFLGWLRERSGSLAPGILAHFLNNLLAILLGRFLVGWLG